MIPKNLNILKGRALLRFKSASSISFLTKLCIAVSRDVTLVNTLSVCVCVCHTVNLEATLIMPVPEMFAELLK